MIDEEFGKPGIFLVLWDLLGLMCAHNPCP